MVHYADRVTRWLWTALLLGATLSLIVSYRVATQSLDIGSVAGGWTYQYLYGFQPRTLVVVVVVCMCCAVIAAVPLDDVSRYHQWRVVFLWIAIASAAQGVLRTQTPYTLEAVFVSDGANGFYGPTQEYRASQLIREFNRLRPTFASVHAKSNMPGKLLFVSALRLVSDRPAVLVWLVIAISNLGGALLYLFVRDWLNERKAALLSLVFYLFVPARLYFLPVLNTVTPVLIVGWAWLWLRWSRAPSAGSAAVLGVALYLIVFYEPTPLVMGLLFAALTAQALAEGSVRWPTLLLHGALAALAFISTYALVFAWLHFDLLGTFRTIAVDAAAFNNDAHRPYWTWVSQNSLDFFFGAGGCQAVLFVACVISAIVHWHAWPDRESRRAAALFLGIAASVLAVDFLGLNRGEVVRLWIFLACFAQIPAAYVCARLSSRAAIMLVLSTSVLQSAIGTSMIAFAQP
jgi:hypothetical protein